MSYTGAALSAVSDINVKEVLLPLALILIFSKILSLLGKKIGLPQVIGMIVAGILLGLIRLIPGEGLFTPSALEGLSFVAEIGVLLIMFSAGIGTDLKQFKKIGLPSVVITVMGVICPLGLGFLVAAGFLHGTITQLDHSALLSSLFYGTILAATSVSITVAALKELGKLNSKIGMSIVAAAIIDDIIGVILLSLFISLEKSGGAGDIGKTIGMMIAFFAAAVAVGFLFRILVKAISKRHPHTRRIPILGFAMCFFFAYAAEEWFGVADITGAYVAGLLLAGISESEYMDKKIEVSNYLIFAPVFFANIGIANADQYAGMTGAMVGFGFCFILAGIAGKLIGCGAGALMCGYGIKDSLRVGVGMMVRAEVVLVCAQKGVDAGMVNPTIMPFVLLLIIITTLLTPLLLKFSYRHENNSLPPIGGDGGTDASDTSETADVQTQTDCTALSVKQSE